MPNNIGAFGENFPYSNFHDFNMDWIIKIAKDFLDQYTQIQEVIANGEQSLLDITADGLEQLQEKADTLEELLQNWYNSHSEDIANQLADALDELNTALNNELISFRTQASIIASEVAESIPDDYSTLSAKVNNLETAIAEQVLTPVFNPGFIVPTSLEFSTGGSHVISDPILIKADTLLYVPRVSRSTNTTLVAECTQDGTPTKCLVRGTSSAESDGSLICIPFLYDTYVRLGGNTAMSAYMKYTIKPYREDFIFDETNIHDWMPNRLDEDLYATGAITDNGTDAEATWFTYTASLRLMKGMTLEYWATSGSNINILSEYDLVNYSFIASIEHGNSTIQHMKYTAPRNMFVRICSRNYPSPAGFAVVMPTEKFHSWKIYNPRVHFKNVENSPLYNKVLTVMGDSLIEGNVIGNGATWINTIGMKYNMTYNNMGQNAGTVTEQDIETIRTPMVNRISSVPTNTNFFVLLGGANDKRLNVPIGDITDTVKTTFCGALNNIIDELHTRIPKAHLLFMTTYDRYDTLNNMGFGDADYAEAMIAVCKNRNVPVFDNYHCSGISFTIATLDNWMDEFNNRQWDNNGAIEYIEPTHHLSVECYDWLVPMYERLLESSTATGYEPDTNIDPYYIDTILAMNNANDLTGTNSYVRTSGKWINLNDTIYFKAIFETRRTVNISTGNNVITNLPAPIVDRLIFNESHGKLYTTGSKLNYADNNWYLRGSRTVGNIGVVYGMYKA